MEGIGRSRHDAKGVFAVQVRHTIFKEVMANDADMKPRWSILIRFEKLFQQTVFEFDKREPVHFEAVGLLLEHDRNRELPGFVFKVEDAVPAGAEFRIGIHAHKLNVVHDDGTIGRTRVVTLHQRLHKIGAEGVLQAFWQRGCGEELFERRYGGFGFRRSVVFFHGLRLREAGRRGRYGCR